MALLEDVGSIVVAINSFTNCHSFESLEAPLRTSKQGVYLVVVFNAKWKLGFRLYVGSSCGGQGLRHRVFDNHGMESHRNLRKTRS